MEVSARKLYSYAEINIIKIIELTLTIFPISLLSSVGNVSPVLFLEATSATFSVPLHGSAMDTEKCEAS
jgi:hypothetical protein